MGNVPVGRHRPVSVSLVFLLAFATTHASSLSLSGRARPPRASITMVEGHSVHRLASAFRTRLVGRRFSASSPNGRFAEGASAIDGLALSGMEAVGKNLFAFFGNGGEEVTVHVHFGMSGAWAVFGPGEEEPEVRPTTRLRLEEVSRGSKSSGYVTHLSAMTVVHGDSSLYLSKKVKLGQDPLRPDADPDALYAKVAKSRKTIGQLLMDQSFFAGPGNIYRAEILLVAGIHPNTVGSSMDRPLFDNVWDASGKLLRRGYNSGSILTVDPKTDPVAAARGERRYIYNKSRCARCGGKVTSWDVSGRTCYACEGGCQPKMPKIEEGSASAVKVEDVTSSMIEGCDDNGAKQPRQHVPFISHCARVPLVQRLDEGGPERLTIKEICSIMETILAECPEPSSFALPAKGAKKAVHVEALQELLIQNGKRSKSAPAVKPELVQSRGSTLPLPPPSTGAEDAAREKAMSGENRAVEHIAELSGAQAIRAAAVTPDQVDSDERKAKPSMNTSTKKGGKRSPARKQDVQPRRSSRRRLKYES